jgi:hypothetical protein
MSEADARAGHTGSDCVNGAMTMPRSQSALAFATNAGSSARGKCALPMQRSTVRVATAAPVLLSQRVDTLRERPREAREEPRDQGVHSCSEKVERERDPEQPLRLGGHDVPQGPRGLGSTNGAATARDRSSTPSAFIIVPLA